MQMGCHICTVILSIIFSYQWASQKLELIFEVGMVILMMLQFYNLIQQITIFMYMFDEVSKVNFIDRPISL